MILRNIIRQFLSELITLTNRFSFDYQLATQVMEKCKTRTVIHREPGVHGGDDFANFCTYIIYNICGLCSLLAKKIVRRDPRPLPLCTWSAGSRSVSARRWRKNTFERPVKRQSCSSTETSCDHSFLTSLKKFSFSYANTRNYRLIDDGGLGRSSDTRKVIVEQYARRVGEKESSNHR